MKRHKKKFWFIVPLVIAGIALFVWFFQWLWNILLPEIIGVKAISYWQALGILVLSKILFGGGFKRKGNDFRIKMQKFRRMRDFGEMKKNFGYGDLKDFTDEERQRFREEWMKRFKL